MSGIDIVVHNAGQYEVGVDKAGKQRMYLNNVVGTENVLSLAQENNIPRTIHVSTIQAFGETGRQLRDETYTRQFPCRTIYEQTKTDAHKIALQYRQRGLPLIIVCPHQVIGVNDHSEWGYFQRLYVNRIMPPFAWSPNSIYSFVELHDLAEGIALATESGRIGETYFLCGERQTLREIFNLWSYKPGRFTVRFWLPAGFMAVLFAPLEPLQRILGLPATFSRETVRLGATNFYYCNEKAKRELGWTHCSAEEMWDKTIDGEIQLLSKRKNQNLIQRLIPLEIVD